MSIIEQMTKPRATRPAAYKDGTKATIQMAWPEDLDVAVTAACEQLRGGAERAYEGRLIMRALRLAEDGAYTIEALGYAMEHELARSRRWQR